MTKKGDTKYRWQSAEFQCRMCKCEFDEKDKLTAHTVRVHNFVDDDDDGTFRDGLGEYNEDDL